MPSKGRKIPCPLGPSIPKKRAKVEPQGSARIVAELEASQSILVQKETHNLQRALADINFPLAGPRAPNELEELGGGLSDAWDEDDINQIDINEFIPDNNEDIGNPEVAPDPHVSYGEYIRGSYYKTKQLKDGSNWKKVLGDMFIAYMTCSQKTSQWGDINVWDINHNKSCACGASKQRKRKVDIVDILGQSDLAFPLIQLSF